MRLGLSMLFCLNEPFAALIERLGKIEVDHVEIVDEGIHSLNARRVSMLKKAIEANDLSLTVHAPFADINIASTSPLIRRAIIRRLKKSIVLSAQLNPKYWVFHPGIQSAVSDEYPGLDWRINLESVRDLLKVAGQNGLKISIENVPDPFPFLLKRAGDFEKFYKDLGEDGLNLSLTLDVGHSNINKQTYDFLEKLSGKIVHVHLHDNLGDYDSHMGIGFGNIEWLRLMKAFKKINYDGILLVESKKNIEESLEMLKSLIKKA
ncbi:MAG: sugar phosphate isomerase/epimerase family protein [Candidatus Bathyarchaeia archaeon]